MNKCLLLMPEVESVDLDTNTIEALDIAGNKTPKIPTGSEKL